VRLHAPVPLDETQVLSRAEEIRLVREIRCLDDQRLALPTAARVSQPLPDLWRNMRTVAQQDRAIASAVVAFVVDRHGIGGLHNPGELAEKIDARQLQGAAPFRAV